MLEAFIIGGARWAERLNAGGGPLGDGAMWVLMYLPVIVLAAVMVGIAARTTVMVYREKWSDNFVVVIPAVMVIWLVFCLLNAVTIWEELFS